MEIRMTNEQGRVPVTVLHIKGAVDASSYEQLQTSAQAAIAKGSRNLLFDLNEVPFMSSAGMRAINHIYTLLHSESEREAVGEGMRTGKFKSPHLKLLKPSSNVLRSLQMAGFDMFLETHGELKDAVNSF